MNFKQFFEMPITNFTKIGDWSPDSKKQYGFDRKDAALLSNEKAVQKIHRLWSNSKNNYDFYFIRNKEAYKFREIGEVTSDWVKQNLNLDIKPRENAITIIFTNNTGAEKMVATAWTLAHRLGHATRMDDTFNNHFMKEIERDFIEILREVYGIKGNIRENEKELRALAYAVGTMKSARQINLRNFYEFMYELLAQYIITGTIKFNPLPRSLILKRTMAWGRPNYKTKYTQLDKEELTEWNETLDGYAGKYEIYLDSIFNGFEERMFLI